jgi:hypothetical protein
MVRFGSCLRVAILMCLTSAAVAQMPPAPTPPPRKGDDADPRIVAALKQVSTAQIRATIEKLASFQTRHTLSATPEMTAAGRGIGAAREWIRSQFERYSKDCGGCLEVKLQSFTAEPNERIKQPSEIVNVYAVLRGSERRNAGRTYLVSGHYDSRNSDPLDAKGAAPGANDDASGTAVVLEAARVLSKLKFPATIIFIAFAGEEQGLVGSEHFARTAKEQKMDVEAVLNNDIVGGNRDKLQEPSIVRVFSEGIPIAAGEAELRQIRSTGGENDSPSRQLARYIREVWRTYFPRRAGSPPRGGVARDGVEPKMVFRRDRYLRGGDHTSFNEQGYAAVRFSEYREDYNRQHQNPRIERGVEFGDLPKFVDFDYVANVARLNIATLASLASAPAPPENVRLLTRELTNDSTITWESSPGGLAARYEVLWRATSAPDWENIESVGRDTRVTLKRSKDNVIFAVRAVDRRGHRSLAVVPVPVR